MKRIFAPLVLLCVMRLCAALPVQFLYAQDQNDGQNQTRQAEPVSDEDREIIENIELLEHLELFLEDDIDMIQNLDIFLANS